MERIVTTWQENGMQYTITAKPITQQETSIGPPNQLLSIFEYLGGKTPEKGTGDKVYKHAKQIGAKFEIKNIETRNYTGKIMLYERSFLDVHFNQNTTPATASVSTTTPSTTYVAPVIDYDPADDDLPF
jgi:hypothetical protein